MLPYVSPNKCSSWFAGGPLSPFALPQIASPRLWTDARKPHIDPRPLPENHAAVRQAEETRRIPRQLQETANVRARK